MSADVLKMQVARDFAERFDARLEKTGHNGCWIFQGCVAPNGYGHGAAPHKKSERVHRTAFLIANGWLPRGKGGSSLLIRHTCDVRLCCNPEHLIVGTALDNVNDAISRDRAVAPPTYHGASHPRAKMTWAKARLARRLKQRGDTCASLARRFSVGETTMGHLLAGRTWQESV